MASDETTRPAQRSDDSHSRDEGENQGEPLDGLEPSTNIVGDEPADSAHDTAEAEGAAADVPSELPFNPAQSVDLDSLVDSSPPNSDQDAAATGAPAESDHRADDNDDPFASFEDDDSSAAAEQPETAAGDRPAIPATPSPTPADASSEDRRDEELAFLEEDPPSARRIDPFADGQDESTTEVDASPDLSFLSEPTPQERRAVWQAASRWSLAAAMFARGADDESWQRTLRGARDAASEIAIELPPLPSAEEDKLAQIVRTLSGEPESAGAELVDAVQRRTSATEAASARLAIRANLLLLTYSPSSSEAAQLAQSIESIAESSSVPQRLWQPLVELLAQRADFDQVKRAVFQLHRQAPQSFGRESAPQAFGTGLDG